MPNSIGGVKFKFAQGSYNGHPYIGDSGRQMIGMLNN